MIEIDDPMMLLSHGDVMTLVGQYRALVGALLEHTTIDHEGTEAAIADFFASNDRAVDVLKPLIALQRQDREEVDS